MKRLLTIALFLAAAALCADSLTTGIRVHLFARHVATSGATDAPDVVYGRTLLSGYGTDQADRIGRYAGEVSTSTPVAFNLITGMLDSFGQTATFTSIKAASIRNESLTNTISIVGALGSLTVAPDGVLLTSAPLAGIAPGTITVSLATGTPASFSVLFIGASQ